MVTKPSCDVCMRPDRQKPMCFRGTRWCCELHRRVLLGLLTKEQADLLADYQSPRDKDVMP